MDAVLIVRDAEIALFENKDWPLTVNVSVQQGIAHTVYDVH